MLAKREGGQSGTGTHIGPTDKGKAIYEEVITERVEPITTIMLSPHQPPPAPTSEPRDKKEKKEKEKSSKCASDHLFSQRSPKRLKEAITEQEITSTFNFLNKRTMISNRVVLELNDYEKRQYTSCFHKELKNALLELNVRTLLIGRVVGEELFKEDSGTIEKLKVELAEATSSLNSALNANMELAHNNKELELETEAAKGQASELRKTIEALRAENGFLRECSRSLSKNK